MRYISLALSCFLWVLVPLSVVFRTFAMLPLVVPCMNYSGVSLRLEWWYFVVVCLFNCQFLEPSLPCFGPVPCMHTEGTLGLWLGSYTGLKNLSLQLSPLLNLHHLLSRYLSRSSFWFLWSEDEIFSEFALPIMP